jgi:hypothetical protein
METLVYYRQQFWAYYRTSFSLFYTIRVKAFYKTRDLANRPSNKIKYIIQLLGQTDI